MRRLNWISEALPAVKLAITRSLMWGLTMAISVGFSLWMDGYSELHAYTDICALFAFGGLIAFTPALIVAGMIANQGQERRFSAAFLAFSIATIGVTALLYALHFRIFISEPQATPFTFGWIFEFGFTIGASAYLFAALALRHFFPIGLIALFAVSFWYANRSR